VVDLISGVVHWFEDSYGHPSLPFVGRRITRPNLLHHFRPRAFVSHSWYSSSQLLLFGSLAAIAIAWFIGKLSPMVVLGAVLGANANQVHKWSHQTPAENGPVIDLLQRLRMIQSPRHHLRHHSGGKDSHYCVLTQLLNPVLDCFRVWRGLEWALRPFGLERRNDDRLLAVVLSEDPDFLNRASPGG
jgi:ubiquitin-conjugating enzyme E2 variant